MNASHIHKNAELARENDEHLKALKLLEEAIIMYQKGHDYEGLAQALQSRVLTYKHLFLLTKDDIFAILAKKDAEASLEITQKYNINRQIGSCYFRLGEVDMLSKDYKNAIENYKLSLVHYSGTDAEKGDHTYHMGEALYRNSQKEKGTQIMLQGLQQIRNNTGQIDPFLAHVWESGCYLKLAELLFEDEKEKSKEYLEKAEQIITSDPKLVIRKRQLRDLKDKLHYIP